MKFSASFGLFSVSGLTFNETSGPIPFHFGSVLVENRGSVRLILSH